MKTQKLKKIYLILISTILMMSNLFAESIPGSLIFDISEGHISVENGTSEGNIKISYGDNLFVDDVDPLQEITIIGSTSTAEISINTAIPLKITLNDVVIDVSTRNYVTAFVFIDQNSNVSLTLLGTNILKSGRDCAGISVTNIQTLTITEKSTGNLTAIGENGGSGIGGGYNASGGDIIINGGIITATGNSGGAGIGGGGYYNQNTSAGNITINGGIITATGGNSGGSGIGSESKYLSGTVNISGSAEVIAKGGSGMQNWAGDRIFGPGVGICAENILITSSKVFAHAGNVFEHHMNYYTNYAIKGKLSTGESLNPNLVIHAFTERNSHLSDYSNSDTWSMRLVTNDGQTIYGKCNLNEFAIIPENKILTIEKNSILIVADGETLTNNGTIIVKESGEIFVNGILTNNNKISNYGRIKKDGKIPGIITGNIEENQPWFFHDISKENVKITEDTMNLSGHIITGTTNINNVIIESGTHNIEIENLRIELDDNYPIKFKTRNLTNYGAFELQNSANVNLKISGENIFTSGKEKAGLQVPAGTTILCHGNGSLIANGGTFSAGIGGGKHLSCGEITFTENITVFANSGIAASNAIGAGSGAFGGVINRKNGIFIENQIVEIYGSYIIARYDFTINQQTLEIGESQILVVNNGVTITNNGTIANKGMIMNHGTITGEITENKDIIPHDIDLLDFVLTTDNCRNGCDGHVIFGKTDKNKINIGSGNHKIIFNDLDISLENEENFAIFDIHSNANINLQLIGKNKLSRKSTEIQNPCFHLAESTTLTISGKGSLFVNNQENNQSLSGNGDIIINSGRIETVGRGFICNNFTANGGNIKIISIGHNSGFGVVGVTAAKTIIRSGLVEINGSSHAWPGNQFAISGLFETGKNGNAIIYTTGIEQKENIRDWSGIIFENNNGKLYGDFIFNSDFEIKNGQSLTIDYGKILTINENVTLINKGTITNNGKIFIKGTLDNADGIIQGYGKIMREVGDFIVEENDIEMNYSYANNLLTITDDEFWITMQDGKLVTSDSLLITGNATINLSNIIIDSNNRAALVVDHGANTTINFTGENKFGSHWDGISNTNIIVRDSSTLNISGYGTLFCSESYRQNKLSIAENCTVNSSIALLNLRAADALSVIVGDGTFTVNGGEVKLRTDNTTNLISANTKVILNSGKLSQYEKNYNFGGASVEVYGGILDTNNGDLNSPIFNISNGVVFTKNITNSSNEENWNGIIFKLHNGYIYGNLMLFSDLTIPSDKYLFIQKGQILKIPHFVTFINYGTILNSGTIETEDGEFLNYGTIMQIDGTESAPFKIYTPADLVALSNLVENESSTGIATCNNFYQLMNDIDMDKIDFKPIGGSYRNDFTTSFAGKFNGNGHKIKNLKIVTSWNYAGLFGNVATEGNIENVIIDSSYAINNPVAADAIIGSLAGHNNGTINNCYTICNFSMPHSEMGSLGGLVGQNQGVIKNCGVTGNVTGYYSVGGLVGQNGGFIYNSYATGNITVDSALQSSTSVVGGGLVGENLNNGTIKNCFATGTINNGGGLVGQGNNSTIINSFFTDANNNNGIGTLTTTVKMKDGSVARLLNQWIDENIDTYSSLFNWINIKDANSDYPIHHEIIEFDKQGGNGGTHQVPAIFNEPMIEASKPIKIGYTFLGYFDAKISGIKYYDSEMKSMKNWDKLTMKNILFAQWEKNKENGGGESDKNPEIGNFIGLIYDQNNEIYGMVDFTVTIIKNKTEKKITGKTITQLATYSFTIPSADITEPIEFKKDLQQNFTISYQENSWQMSFKELFINKTEFVENHKAEAFKVYSGEDFTPKYYTFAMENVSSLEELDNHDFIKNSPINSYSFGSVNIDKTAKVKIVSVLGDGTNVTFAGKMIKDARNNFFIPFFSVLSGKSGIYAGTIEFIDSEKLNDFEVYADWKNQKAKTFKFKTQFSGFGAEYNAPNALKNINSTYVLNPVEYFAEIPTLQISYKEAKETKYAEVEFNNLFPQNIEIEKIFDKRFNPSKLSLREKSLAPWYDKAIYEWIYDLSKPDKIGNSTDIIDPNLTTFTFNAKTGFFNGGFSLYYDYYLDSSTKIPQSENNGTTQKHTIVKAIYKGVMIFEKDRNNKKEEEIFSSEGFGTALIPFTEYKLNPITEKFEKFSAKKTIKFQLN